MVLGFEEGVTCEIDIGPEVGVACVVEMGVASDRVRGAVVSSVGESVSMVARLAGRCVGSSSSLELVGADLLRV